MTLLEQLAQAQADLKKEQDGLNLAKANYSLCEQKYNGNQAAIERCVTAQAPEGGTANYRQGIVDHTNNIKSLQVTIDTLNKSIAIDPESQAVLQNARTKKYVTVFVIIVVIVVGGFIYWKYYR